MRCCRPSLRKRRGVWGDRHCSPSSFFPCSQLELWLCGSSQFVGCSEEEGAVFRVAGLVEAEHGEFVAGGGGVAVEEMFDRDAEGVGDAADVFAELAGAVGFPLGDGAAADVAGGGELELGEAAGAAEFADARADGRGGGVHGGSMRECC
jgi:hypothetical protein